VGSGQAVSGGRARGEGAEASWHQGKTRGSAWTHLLVLRDEIIHVALGLSELHLVHSLTCTSEQTSERLGERLSQRGQRTPLPEEAGCSAQKRRNVPVYQWRKALRLHEKNDTAHSEADGEPAASGRAGPRAARRRAAGEQWPASAVSVPEHQGELLGHALEHLLLDRKSRGGGQRERVSDGRRREGAA